VARTFGVPVGFPSGQGYYDAQDFGVNNHLGEDWNGVGGGASDRGDPVVAMAAGRVTFAEDAGEGWGNVVRVVHHTRLQGHSVFVESLYAHLDRIDVNVGAELEAGQQLGTIGDAHGAYVPHLHFEVRRRPDLPLGPGYSVENSMYLDPSAYIAEMQ
jgi:murein DD-endopeptidase MepM/ murein hydrolase activator NlpD